MGQTPSSSSRKFPEPFSSRSSSIRSSGTFRKQLKIGTLRKKIAKTLKGGRTPDYRRHMREMLETWDLKDVSYLVQEYEALLALKDIITMSEMARESVPSLRSDLSSLYESKMLTDVVLVYKGTLIPVHRPILVCRCSFFEKKLSSIIDVRKPVRIDLEVEGLTVSMFSMLIKYLYTGEMFQGKLDCEEIFKKLGERFGVPNVLEKDFKSLLETGLVADVILEVASGGNSPSHRSNDVSSLEFKCHSAILSCRSSYFKALITRKFRDDPSSISAQRPLRIVLDENIIPRQYIRVLLQCMYLDCVDLRSIIKWKTADDNNGIGGETDKLLSTPEIAMELYEIGKFLDFPALCQACEDIIIEEISSASLVGVLEWSWQPFGSQWVHRQALRYFREDFVSVAKSTAFIANLPKKYFIEAMNNDLLQASEEEILSAVVRWGEWQVSKAIDKQNGLPTSSLNRRSPKRKDINDEDLYEAIKDISPFIRIKQVIPKSSVVLQMAYHRRLLQRPLDVATGDSDALLSTHWVRSWKGRHHGNYVRPRLFIPYYEEAKAFLSESMMADASSTNLRAGRFTAMPDIMPTMDAAESEGTMSDLTLERFKSYSADFVSIDRKVIKRMGRREKELKRMHSSQKALSLLSDGNTHVVNFEIQKRVMREFGYPDSFACEVFRHAPDIIEDSSSSSGSSSSRHSTLSKLGTTQSDVATAPDVTIPASEMFSRGDENA